MAVVGWTEENKLQETVIALLIYWTREGGEEEGELL